MIYAISMMAFVRMRNPKGIPMKNKGNGTAIERAREYFKAISKQHYTDAENMGYLYEQAIEEQREKALKVMDKIRRLAVVGKHSEIMDAIKSYRDGKDEG